MKYDTPTLLIVLVVSNFLMAGAMWIAFAGRFRDGLGRWTGALVVQGGAWLLIINREALPDFTLIRHDAVIGVQREAANENFIAHRALLIAA